MATPTYLEVAFLPWIGLRDEVKVGPVTIWPFERFVDTKIKDTAIAEHLKKYFLCYVNSRSKPVDTVAICEIENKNFSPFSPEEYATLRRAVNSLCFATVVKATEAPVVSDNRSFAPPDVDCFLLYFQRFTPGNDNVAITSGHTTSFGWTLKELKFQQPAWVTSGFGINTRDKDLLELLGAKLLLKSWSTKTARIFNALEWFRLSHTGGDHISFEPRIVMTSSAFESLIELPKFEKKFPLMEQIDSRHFGDRLYRKSFTYKSVTKKFSLAGAFVNQFYELRNAIVHGNKIRGSKLSYSNRALKAEKKGEWLTQQIVADLLLYEIVWREVAKPKNLPSLKWKFDSLHRALGWKKAI